MGRSARFFAEDLAPEVLRLSADEAHHALNVLRLPSGAEVELFDGRGGLAVGRIVEARRGGVAVRVEAREDLGPRPGPAVHLAFAVPKGKRLDWLLEKATLLAAASLQPVAFQRSVGPAAAGRLAPVKRRRWLTHCIAAARQGGLNWLPEIRDGLPLADFLTDALTDPAGYVGVVGVVDGGSRPIREILARAPAGREICLLIGPEGGLTRAELADVVEAGFTPARLGRTILRVETAAIALLAAAVAVYGEQ